MLKPAPKFVIGPDGRKEAVVLRLTEFRRLMRKIEDLEDALALEGAEQSSRRLLPYEKVRKQLRRAGKL